MLQLCRTRPICVCVNNPPFTSTYIIYKPSQAVLKAILDMVSVVYV